MTAERDFATFFTAAQLPAYQDGVMAYSYRGVPCFKSPIDIAIYLRLLWEARPGAIIEIGSKAGGSALLLRDFAANCGLRCEIVSIDIAPPEAAWDAIRFIRGDVHDLAPTFAAHGLYDCPRPWLVIDDSAHTHAACRAALDFFAPLMRTGEHLVIEDGVLADLGWSARYDGGPNRAITEFLAEHPDAFEIATAYCDMFGHNATYNPNGYLRRR
jgi:cephalosporin hydroxylase